MIRTLVGITLVVACASCSDDLKSRMSGRKQPETKAGTAKEAGTWTFLDRASRSKTACPELAALANTEQDASPALSACVAATPDDGVLEIPPGVYVLTSRIDLTKPMTLTTTGRMNSPGCGAAESHGCAELKAAASLATPYGLLLVQGANIVVDHIVLNGNLTARSEARSQCSNPALRASGFNARMIACPGCAFIGSVSKFAPCGTGLEVAGPNQRFAVIDSDFANNGVHSVVDAWADGLTVHQVTEGIFRGNRFHNNTDVDLIFGGCQSCAIEDNRVTHDGSYASGAFAAIMVQAFTTTTDGRYDDSVIRRNEVNCGEKQACGYGLYVGSRSWYEASRIVNGTVSDNTVSHTQGGIVIGRDVTGTVIGDNDAGPTNGQVTCNTIQEGFRPYHALTVETGSEAQFTGSRVPRAMYVEVLYNVGTIPNSAPGCKAVPGASAGDAAAPLQCTEPNYKWIPERPGQCTPSCGQAVVDAGATNPRQMASAETCSQAGGTPLESWEQFTGSVYCCASKAIAASAAPEQPTTAVSDCPGPNRAMVVNRHAGGQTQCVPSCGQAAVDAGRQGAQLLAPNRANPQVAADVANMCPLSNMDYLFSYEEVTQGSVCCVSP